MRTTLTVIVFSVATLFWLAIGMPRLFGYDDAIAGAAGSRTVVSADGTVREYGYGLVRFNGHGPEWHRWQRVKANRKAEKLIANSGRTIRRLQREVTLKYEPTFEHYFTIAALAYHVDREMLERKGRCESVNFTDFYNDTPIYNGEHAQGVMGFIPSTFNTSSFRGLDVRYDHLANIMAGAELHARGRGGEWVCR